MTQVKEQIKAPEKIQVSNEEIANLSDAQFKTLVIRMLTEMVEYGHKIEEKVKAMKSEIKENVQGTNSEGKETGTRANSLEQKEEINIQPEQNEEKRKKVAQTKKQIKAPEKIQLSNEEIDNLSDAQFKTLVIRSSQNWLNLVAN